jgi:hypothetical protein
MSPMSPRTLRPRQTGFNPASISNLALWLDANDSSSITTVSGAVSEWRDKSAAKRVFSQSTANNRPTLQSGAIGTMPAIRFDGSNDRLTTTASVVGLVNPVTLFIAGRKTGASADGGLFTLDKSGGFDSYSDDSLFCITTNSNGGAVTVLGGPVAQLFQALGSASDALGSFLVSLRIAANSDAEFRNRTAGLLKADTSFTFSSTPTPTGASIGVISVNAGGGNTSYVHFLNGDIGEVIAYSRALSASEQSQVAAYLAKKYGLTLA